MDKKSKVNNHDFPTVLRLVAISLIVANHFDMFDYGGGGSELLMLMVGYNIATFKIKAILDVDSASPIIGLIIKVMIPTIGFLLILQLYYDSFMWSTILLVSNFFDEGHPMGFSYWFINVYVQILLFVFILLSIKPVRDLIRNNRKLFSFLLVIFSMLIYVTVEMFWDTHYLYRRVPHAMLWMFSFGFAARYMDNTLSRSVLSILFALMSYIYFDSLVGIFFICTIFLIFDFKLVIPKVIKKPVYILSLSSLFIYLTHFQVKSIMEKIIPNQPEVYLIVALLFGAVVNFFYSRAYKHVKEKLT